MEARRGDRLKNLEDRIGVVGALREAPLFLALHELPYEICPGHRETCGFCDSLHAMPDHVNTAHVTNYYGRTTRAKMKPTRSENQSSKKSLSLKTLRLLHRYLDDFVLVNRAKSGSLPPAELERLLRAEGANNQEIQEVLSEYNDFRM